MKSITCFNDLAAYGIDPLTGEACGLSYRILCDVTERGRAILARALGVPNLVLPEPWNRGSATDPHVGSVMLCHEMLVPLGVFALLESGCAEAWLVRDGGVLGVEPGDGPALVEANRILLGDRVARKLAYRGTAGDRNVHQMSGRVE